jgi:hypothetical protein
MGARIVTRDGVFLQELSVQAHTDELVVRTDQVNRGQILSGNAILRSQFRQRRTDGLRLALRIPDEDIGELRRKYPELASRDAETRSRAWARFIQSSESAPYRVQDRVG